MNIFTGKTLMITGGTGSFGNAVLNRFLKTDIAEIRIFSRDEKKQDDMRHEYQAKMPEVAHKIKFFIGDDRNLLIRLWLLCHDQPRRRLLVALRPHDALYRLVRRLCQSGRPHRLCRLDRLLHRPAPAFHDVLQRCHRQPDGLCQHPLRSDADPAPAGSA